MFFFAFFLPFRDDQQAERQMYLAKLATGWKGSAFNEAKRFLL